MTARLALSAAALPPARWIREESPENQAVLLSLAKKAHRSAALRAMAARTRSMTSSITTATSSGTNIGRKRESLVLLRLAAPDRTLLLSGKTLQSLVLLSLAAPDRTLLLSGKTLPLSFPWRSNNRLAPSVLFSLA